MPRCIRRGIGKLEESPSIVGLECIADEKEGQQEAQPAPHPRMKALDGDVHVMTLAQRLEPIQQSLLIAELQVLHNT